MPTTIRLSTALLALLAVTLFASSAVAQLGDPDGYTTNPDDLDHLISTRFDESAVIGTAFVLPWTWRGVIYGGSTGLVTNNACIPGLDGAAFDGDPTTECGGDNFYLVHDGARVLTPVLLAGQVGFHYGSLGSRVIVRVRLSDASVREFVLSGRDAEGRGTAGYFGYATGDPLLAIEQVWIISELGGVDGVAFGYTP